MHQQQDCTFLQTDIGKAMKIKMIQWPVGKEAQTDGSSSLAINGLNNINMQADVEVAHLKECH